MLLVRDDDTPNGRDLDGWGRSLLVDDARKAEIRHQPTQAQATPRAHGFTGLHQAQKSINLLIGQHIQVDRIGLQPAAELRHQPELRTH